MRLALGCLLLTAAVGCYADTVTFSDYNEWAAAATAAPGSFLINETFAGDHVNTPGLTITATSTWGVVSPGDMTISNGVVSGCVGTTGCPHGENSIWTIMFTSEMYGLWFPNISVSNATIYGLQFYPDNSQVATLHGPAGQYGGYDSVSNVAFGFATDTPFSELTIAEDIGFADFEFAGGMIIGDPIDPLSPLAAPEPALLLPLGGLLLLTVGSFRRSFAKARA